ncbi:GntR family transcriptional regulator [Roseinatronobacter alkalisoli]|uniref:GntR family transcriptional regulator n=1 Tax=Roseinatronobacter alkalisoli TaxID=3028235 RepID=A0ABT5TDM5_9RHOB|nr:GntR family transcriptional regulator [Roseinatronobacter sp. HJB301]MDD7972800.1 GntR family transcriptional regulator [Roseinatronobacter sp. HJB301]
MTTPKRKQSRADVIYESLRRMIVTLELPPKHVLQERELAEKFAVSRTPVREAILRLAEQELVVIAPQHGTFVAAISPDSVRQAHFLRVNLETPVVDMLCQAGELDLSVPRAVILEQKLVARHNSYAEYMPLDDRFHQSLFEIAGMGGIWQVIHARKAHLDRIRFLKAAERSELDTLTRQHEAILDGIANRSRLGAQELIRAHVSGSLAFMQSLLHSNPELFEQTAEP